MEKQRVLSFTSLALLVSLLTPASSGARALEVWSPNPLVEIREGPDYSGKNDPKCAIRVVGTRNGEFSGQVVIYSKEGMKGPEAKVSDLELTDGNSVLPASAVQVRYALPTGPSGRERLPQGHMVFDALSNEPRAEGATHPVWITVNVPADAEPGEYKGRLIVAGRKVPIVLTVCAWRLPIPEDYWTWADFIESPESVALQYELKLWSDEHFEKIGTCFDQLGKVGNKVIYIPLVCMSNFGNEQTMVRWVEDGHGGFRHDFSPVERYLDLYIERIGRPRVVVLYLYEGRLGGGQGRNREECDWGAPVTLLKPETGEVSTFEGPCLNHALPERSGHSSAFPEYPAQTEAFWKPVLDGLRQRLNNRGIEDKSIMLGLFPDLMPGKRTVELLQRVAPYAVWAEHGHGKRSSVRGVPIGYGTAVWGAAGPPDPDKGNRYGHTHYHGWQQTSQLISSFYDREISKPGYGMQLVRSRLLGERNIAGKQRGFGRMNADFWPVLAGTRGRRRSLSARYPRSNWSQLNLGMAPYLFPGLDGALSTIRFEMLREGVQECEARIFVEKALLDEAKRSRLGEGVAKKCRSILDERVRALRIAMGDRSQNRKADHTRFVQSDSQARSKDLYSAAAEVAQRLRTQ